MITRAIIDFNAVCFAQYYGSVAKDTDLDTDEDRIIFFKHCVLNKLAELQKILKANETIIATEGGSWRDKEFKYYKAKRREDRNKNSASMEIVFDCINALIADMPNLNYKVINIDGAEADDIIGVLADKFERDKETKLVYIVSQDKDFQQLTSAKIKLFDHKQMKVINCADKDTFMVKMLFTGDRDDGIPNVFSDDDVFVNSDKRQSPCSEKKMTAILTEGIEEHKKTDAVFRANWDRNKKLIMLTEEFIPADIWKGVISEYETISSTFKRKNFMMIGNWFRTHNLNGLMQKLDYLV